MDQPYIIAEPGSTHDGELDAMHALIDIAADAGCAIYKGQWLSSAARLAERRQAAEYLAAYQVLAYPFEWHAELRRHAQDRGMAYACSVYLPEDVERVAEAADFLKVASFESGVLLHAALRAKPGAVIVSLGFGAPVPGLSEPLPMADDPWAILHCVSAYPTPIHQANLARIRRLSNRNSLWLVGFSDHTRHVLMGAYAVAAGAQVLEVHYRLDRTPPTNPDFVVSLRPYQLHEYVARVKDAANALGDGTHTMQAAEVPFAHYRAR